MFPQKEKKMAPLINLILAINQTKFPSQSKNRRREILHKEIVTLDTKLILFQYFNLFLNMYFNIS